MNAQKFLKTKKNPITVNIHIFTFRFQFTAADIWNDSETDDEDDDDDSKKSSKKVQCSQ